nr:DUF262 domain-containing protein [Chloroflexota bacterium]
MISKVNPPKTNPEKLLTIIEDAYHGKVVLPEFQRSFVWTRENIEELLVSILQGYFIGTFLILDTPPEQAIFPFRVVEGLETLGAKPNNHPTVRLVLDGQQRITSLFYVLYEPKIPLGKSQNPYRFFLRLDALMDGNPDDAVYGVSLADRRRLAEMQAMLEVGNVIAFPLFRDSGKFYHWLYNEQQKFVAQEEKDILEGFYRRFADFMVPVVSVSPETGKENIVNIFERINRTGVSLSLFDLAVARLYLKGIDLRKLWQVFSKNNRELAKIIKPEFVLKVIALFEGKEVRKSALLDVIDELEKSRFEKLWEQACSSLEKAYQRVTSPDGYGAVAQRWIPYSTLLVPLAVLLHLVAEKHGGEVMYRKVDRWYWGNVFAQRYDQAVDTTTYRDVREMKEWLDGGNCPIWLENLNIEQVDLMSIQDQRSAVYRGLMCLIVLAGGRDFINGQPAVLKTCQDDHIFPRSEYKSEAQVNCILNRTLISSNQIKGNKKPSVYLPLFLKEHGGDKERLRQTLQSHLISEEAQQAMERDDFQTFIECRRRTFLNEIVNRVRGK